MKTNRPKPEITPEEIREIRQSLGLTQAEAGEILGGGPRAFTKYEAGATKPAVSIINLLRLLEADPSVLSTLRGQPVMYPTSGNGPFEVTGSHISAFTERLFVELLRKLLCAEAHANNLPADAVHVASNIYSADGGEDGRCFWQDGPERTPNLPARFNQFQLKAGEISPSGAAADVLTKSGAMKEMVRDAMENRGVYVMLCAHGYTQQKIKAREKAILKVIRNSGLSISDQQVIFREADQIAAWVNHHPSVAAWVLEQMQPGLAGPFRSWTHWAGRDEHESSPWIEDQRLSELRTRISNIISTPRGVFRVVGLSGVGKARLMLEVLSPTAGGADLSQSTLYAAESEVGPLEIKKAVQNLADNGARAIVVVDGCSAETRRDLTGIVGRTSSRLSLVTIEDEIPDGPHPDEIFKVEEAPRNVVEGIVDRMLPSPNSEDRRRLVQFSGGFPKIALSLCESWNKNLPLASAKESGLVDRFVVGRSQLDAGVILKSAMLLATFRLVRFNDQTNSELDEAAALGAELSAEDLYAAIEDLVRRNVAKRHGRFAALQPRPIELQLAQRQWQQWQPSKWGHVFANTSPKLQERAAKQLALLNDTDIAVKVVRHICHSNGPLWGLQGISQKGHPEVLSALAEIDAETVANLIESSFKEVDLAEVTGDVRRHLVMALAKIAFDSNTFEQGARLLMKLAIHENEAFSNNATGQYKGLFPIVSGQTAASADARLRALDAALNTNNSAQQLIAVEALLEGAKTSGFWRTVGPETHGVRRALEPWQPVEEHARKYVKACAERLADLAKQQDDVGAKARNAIGGKLRSLLNFGLIDVVENIVRAVFSTQGYWREAMKSLGDYLQNDAELEGNDLAIRVKKLINELKPRSMESRVRFLVKEMPWDFLGGEAADIEERDQLQLKVVHDLAVELAAKPEEAFEFLPILCEGEQRKSLIFGKQLGSLLEEPNCWLKPIKEAVCGTAHPNHDLLVGLLSEVAKTEPDLVEEFKKEAAASPHLAPALPQLCLHMNSISPKDIQLAIQSMELNYLEPHYLGYWRLGGVIAKTPSADVARLLNFMLNFNADAYAAVLNNLGDYALVNPDGLDDFLPEVLNLVENIGKWDGSNNQRSDEYRFGEIVNWILEKGRDNSDARTVALLLARKLIECNDNSNERLVATVLPKMLANFSEIVWPLLGQALISNPETAWRLEFVLGGGSGRGEIPVILHLPEDVLLAWCYANPDSAPAVVAGLIPFLAKRENDPEEGIDRLSHKLLNEFGDRENVLGGFSNSMYSFSWAGSATTYYARFLEPVKGLLDHPIPKVRAWARRTLRQLKAEIEAVRTHDEELHAEWNM